MEKIKAVIVQSGGMDSSLCLAQALTEFKPSEILALSFSYGQRHFGELDHANRIAQHFKVKHKVVDLGCLQQITTNALMDKSMTVTSSRAQDQTGESPNTLVLGRNGLMARVASIHAFDLGAKCIYMGIMELEEANSGYRDCSRRYMDLVQEALRIDFNDQSFEIRTPLVYLTKKQTMDLGLKLGVLEFLLENTLSCYEGIEKYGCGQCAACGLRNEGISQFLAENPDFSFSYRHLYP